MKKYWNIEKIKEYLKENEINCVLISEVYKNAREKLEFKCEREQKRIFKNY